MLADSKAARILLDTVFNDGGGGYPEPSGKITITENGTDIDIKDYATADVAVPAQTDADKAAADLVIYCNGGGRANATKVIAKQGGANKPTDLSYLFAYCAGATQFDMSGLDLSVVTKIKGIFQGCSALTAGTLPAGLVVESLQEIFRDCAALTAADISAVSRKSGSSFQLTNAFYNDRNLVSVDLSGLDMSGSTDAGYAFNNCTKLTTITTTAGTKLPDIDLKTMFAGCSALTEASMVNILNALPTTENSRTIQFVSAAFNRLTAEDIAIGTNKGWTVSAR